MGCGRVGAALAADLSREGNDVLVLDIDPAAFRFLPDDFNGTTLVGNGIDLDVAAEDRHRERGRVRQRDARRQPQRDGGADREAHLRRARSWRRRVFDPLREEMYRNMGLRTINPTRVQAKRLKRIIEAPSDEEAQRDRRASSCEQDGPRRRSQAHVHHRHRRRQGRASPREGAGRGEPRGARHRAGRREGATRSRTSWATSSWRATAARRPCWRRRARRAPTCCSPSPATTKTTSCRARSRSSASTSRARSRASTTRRTKRSSASSNVDITVSATSAIMAHIEQELPTHQLIPLMKLKGSGLEIVEVRIPEDSRVVGQPRARTMLLPYQSMITLHRRRGRPAEGAVAATRSSTPATRSSP